MKLPRYKRYNNDFLRITDAFMIDSDDDKEEEEGNHYYQKVNQFLSFKNSDQCFYFAASYYKGLIEWKQYSKKFSNDWNDNDGHCKNIVKYLKKAKNQIKILIILNIEPTLKSILSFQKMAGNKYFKKIDNYKETAFYKQFETRKKILNNLIDHIDRNIRITEEYIRDYLPNNTYYNLIALWKENINMKKCLNLAEGEIKDLEYLYDAGLDFTYELKLKKHIVKKNWKYYFIYLGYFLSSIIGFFSEEDGENFSNYINRKLKENSNEEFVDIEEEHSIFTKIKNMISSIFHANDNNNNINQEENQNNDVQNQNEIQNENLNDNVENKKSPENISKLCFIELKEKTLKIMKEKIIKIFNDKIKDIVPQIKFLIFIDYIFKEQN